MFPKLPDFQQPIPAVVATIHSLNGFEQALHLEGNEVDLLELRGDLLLRHLSFLRPRLVNLSLPVIMTVRAVEEGGRGPQDAQKRADLYRSLLQTGQGIDLELLKAAEMSATLALARELQRPVILSFHDFSGTPSLGLLREKIAAAASLGAALCKIATTLHHPRDLRILLELLELDSPLPLAVMGMGRYGKISRPLLAQAGSRLNYGYLDSPLVPGQWPAIELKKFIRQLEA